MTELERQEAIAAGWHARQEAGRSDLEAEVAEAGIWREAHDRAQAALPSMEPTRPARHTCHATGCSTPVPPRMFMCRRDWYALTPAQRAAIWRTYRPGQEVTKDPSAEYLDAAREAIAYLEARSS